MQFEFCPAIMFNLHIFWEGIKGGSNSSEIMLPGNSHHAMVMYDIVENRFLDQAEGRSDKAKYWISAR